MDILTYNDFLNENILQKAKSVLTGKYSDDQKALQLFEEMKRDFQENDRNCKKIKIYGDLSAMSYVFGEWSHINDPGVANKNIGSKEVSINLYRITMMEYIANPEYVPLLSSRPLIGITPDLLGHQAYAELLKNRSRKMDEIKVEIKPSKYISQQIVQYFLNEYDKQYPQLKKSIYRNTQQIIEIERGEKPTLGYISEFSLNNVECTFSIKDWDDAPKYKKWIKNNSAIKGKSKDGYPVTYCYKPSDLNNQWLMIDPLGEENWGDNEEIKNWINNTTKEEIENKIKKEINI